MKKDLIILVTLIAVSTLSLFFINQTTFKNQSLFQQWKNNYKISFEPEQEVYRKLIFEKNLQKINRHNSDKSQTFKMGINQFIIYEEQQFKEKFLGEIILQSQSENMRIQEQQDTPINIEIDWTTKGGVSPVKNQGSCGSCWAFAAVASCESHSLISKKTAVSLSQQQLVDCSGSYGNHGCNGGSREMALKYIKDKGITSESAYPYKAVTQSCKKEGGDFHISSISSVSGCSGIQNALQGRPVAVAVDAGGWSHYSSGVFSSCGTAINHAVLLVGVVNGAWKIKNSWGTGWGERGFIRLASGNTCGVCNQGGVYPN